MSEPSPSELKEYLKIATEGAIIGGSVLTKYWGQLIQIEDKEFLGDLVTEADKESEKMIVDFLKKQFSHHNILSEEFGFHSGDGADFHWIIDPLDGTINYTHQNPSVAISIALLYKDEPIVGVVFNPIYHEMFQAVRGCGSTLNGQKISVSKNASLEKSLLATGFAYDRRDNPDTNYAEFCYFTHLTQGVRRSGAASLDLAFVAAGRLDGYWERGLKPWDMAAGALLVKEAGGKVTNYDQTPLDLNAGRILATNSHLHDVLSSELLTIRAQILKEV